MLSRFPTLDFEEKKLNQNTSFIYLSILKFIRIKNPILDEIIDLLIKIVNILVEVILL